VKSVLQSIAKERKGILYRDSKKEKKTEKKKNRSLWSEAVNRSEQKGISKT